MLRLLKGARQGLLPEQTKHQKTCGSWWDRAKNFGAQAMSGVTHVGQKGLKEGAAAVKSMSESGQQALSTVVDLPWKAGHALAHGAQTVGTRAQGRVQALASKAFKGAADLTQAGHQQSESMWHQAVTQGQKVFKGAVDYADKHKNQVAIAVRQQLVSCA
jgi:cell division septum initiation protein DivIVA